MLEYLLWHTFHTKGRYGRWSSFIPKLSSNMHALHIHYGKSLPLNSCGTKWRESLVNVISPWEAKLETCCCSIHAYSIANYNSIIPQGIPVNAYTGIAILKSTPNKPNALTYTVELKQKSSKLYVKRTST